MLRARLASLALAGSLWLAAGCSTSFDFLHSNRSMRNPTYPVAYDCPEVGCCPMPCYPASSCPTGGCPGAGVPLISNAHPPIVEGPALFPPSPTPMPFPGTSMPPAYAPRSTPMLPPVTSVPQALVTPSPP